MKHFAVTFEISTKDYSLQELSRLLGSDADNFSHCIDNIRGNDASTNTTWKLESRIPEDSDITEHLNDIRSMVMEKRVLDRYWKNPRTMFYFTKYRRILLYDLYGVLFDCDTTRSLEMDV